MVFFIFGIGFGSGSFQIDRGNLPSHHHTQTLPLIKPKLPLASKLSQTNSFKCSSQIQSFFPQVLYISRAALRLCPSPRNLAFEGSPQEAFPRKVSSQKTETEIRKCLGSPSLLSPVRKTNCDAAVLNPGCKIK